MGILDTLFGRQKPVPIGPERLFAMSTAQLTLETDQHLTASGTAAICFKGVTSGPFRDLQAELQQLLALASRDDGLTLRTYEDELGYSWCIFGGKDFQALITTVHIATQTLLEKGYGSQLAFAIFPFRTQDGHTLYWLYNFKRGAYYPFVPQTDSHDSQRRRNNSEELRLAAALGKELPMESEMDRWFPVWDLPF